jgi:hypothetical protein
MYDYRSWEPWVRFGAAHHPGKWVPWTPTGTHRGTHGGTCRDTRKDTHGNSIELDANHR